MFSTFTSVPGLKVVMPSNPYDAKGLLIQAIRDDDPVIFCEHKLLYAMTGDVPDEDYVIPFGEANWLRDGEDLTIIAFSAKIPKALEAAEDESTPRCSTASDISSLIADKAFKALKAPIKKVTASHTPVPFSPSLEQAFIPQTEGIISACREVIGSN